MDKNWSNIPNHGIAPFNDVNPDDEAENGFNPITVLDNHNRGSSYLEAGTKTVQSGLHMREYAYAHHDGVALECDIYSDTDFPQDAPAFLYFHAGGLVGWNRRHVPPWLVQACFRRKWPLISADYRFLPQVGGHELKRDAKAAYAFASHFNTPFGTSRRVVVGGSSAGFFLACTLARDRTISLRGPLLSICGIPSFRFPFFSSSTLLTPEPIEKVLVSDHEEGPVKTWVYEEGDPQIFDLVMLNPDGSKNEKYVPASDNSVPSKEVSFKRQKTSAQIRRGMLWAYYVHRNLFPSLVGAVDPGFTEATEANKHHRLAWPRTIVIHGDADKDFPLEGSLWMRDSIGEDRVKVFVARRKDHLFELGLFLEDEAEEMGVVRDVLRALDVAVSDTK